MTSGEVGAINCCMRWLTSFCWELLDMMGEVSASILVEGLVADAAVMVVADEEDGVGDESNWGCLDGVDVGTVAVAVAVAVDVDTGAEVGKVMRAGAPASRSRSELEDERDDMLGLAESEACVEVSGRAGGGDIFVRRVVV